MTRHFLIYATLVFFFFPTTSTTQTLWDPEAGVTARHNINKQKLLLAGPAQDESLLLWIDAISGDKDLFGQSLDSEGEPIWDDSSRCLIDTDANLQSVAGTTLTDGWLLIWNDYRNSEHWLSPGELYLQKISTNGQPLWSDGGDPYDGVRRFESNLSPQSHMLYAGTDGDVFIAVANDEDPEPTGATVRLYHFNADGSPAVGWPTDGIVLGSPDDNYAFHGENQPSILPGPPGYLYVYWDRFSGNRVVALVNVSGEIVWRNVQTFDTACPDGEGGLFAAHVAVEYQQYGFWWKQVWGKRIDSDGELMWQDSLSARVEGNDGNVSLVESTPGTAIATWVEEFSSVRHVVQIGGENSLVVHWQNVHDFEGSYLRPRIFSDGSGGAITAVTSSGGDYFQHITENGILIFDPPEGLAMHDVQLAPLNTRIGVLHRTVQPPRSGVHLQHYLPATQTFFPPDSLLHYDTGLEGEYIWDSIHLRAIDSGVSVIWHDSRSGPRQPYMQLLEMGSGTPLLSEYGEPVFPGISSSDNYGPSVGFNDETTAASDGNVFYAGTANGDDLLLQKTTHEGAIQWGPFGVWLNDQSEWIIENPRLLPTSDGGVICVFQAEHLVPFTPDGYGLARLNNNGIAQWRENGRKFIHVVDPPVRNLYDIKFFDSSQSCFALLHETWDNQIRLTAVDAQTPEILWSETVVSQHPYTERNCRLIRIQESLIVIWDHDEGIKGQRYNTDGEQMWGDQPRLFVENPLWGVDLIDASSNGPNGNGFWLKSGNDFGYDFYYHHFDNGGHPVFATPMGSFDRGSMIGMPDGSAYMLAEERSGDGQYITVHYFLWHLPANGFIEPGTYPRVPVGPTGHSQVTEGLVRDGSGGVVVAWHESAPGGMSSIRIQRYDFSTTTVDQAETLPYEWSLAPIYPNPFNGHATISFTVPAPAPVSIALYDVLGREVMLLADDVSFAQGQHRLSLNGADLASGMYFLRASLSGKMALVRKLVIVE